MKKLFLSLVFGCVLLFGCTEETTIQLIEQDSIPELVSEVKQSAKKHDVSEFEKFELQDVIDGDTIRINYNGTSEKIRFLLVDTPETNHETLGEQPFGPEAKEFVKMLLKDEQSVYVEFDVSYRDKYKRLLAYIYTEDGISLQEQLLENGLARVAYIYDPNTKHVDWFKDIQAAAQKQAVGIWSIEDYVTNRGYDKEAYETYMQKHSSSTTGTTVDNHGTSNSKECLIKGNINAKGNKIYHMPGQRDYDKTNAEEMFCTIEEAENAGFTAAKQ